MRRTLLTAVTIALAAGAVVYGAKFKSTWKSPDVDRLNFAGKKVAAVVISPDQDLQISAEEELARQLTALGVQGVPSYRLVPREVIRDKVKVKEWFQQSGTAGLVVIRVVSADKESLLHAGPVGDVDVRESVGLLRLRVGSAIGGVNRSEDVVVTIETLVYSVPLANSCGPA